MDQIWDSEIVLGLMNMLTCNCLFFYSARCMKLGCFACKGGHWPSIWPAGNVRMFQIPTWNQKLDQPSSTFLPSAQRSIFALWHKG